MAEYVEQRMEEMIPELEELERCQLLSSTEVKELLKKRKHHEYKIQKRTKKKEDFINYIQYESNLLSLIAIRREDTGYFHKKGDIDHAIKTRINKLYKILCLRWQADVKTWLSHIAWLKKVGWKSSVSRVHLRLLQVHSGDPRLWIEAAKYEFESGGADNGRQIMLRGLRFHPRSQLLHREYLKFELLYVEKLLARQKVLQLEQEAGGGEEGQEGEEQDGTVKDNVLSCAIVKLVAKSAVEAIPEPNFLLSLLILCSQFTFAASVQSELLSLLQERFPESPVTWDTLARLELDKPERKMRTNIDKCVEVYKQALEQQCCEEMFGKYFSCLTQLPQLAPNCSAHTLKHILHMLEAGQEKDLLTTDQYKFWIQLVDNKANPKELELVLSLSLARFPGCVELWEARLTREMAANPGGRSGAAGGKRCLKAMEAAREHLDKEEDCVRLWRCFVRVMTDGGEAEAAFSLVRTAAQQQQGKSGWLRVFLLELARERGLSLAREVYTQFRLLLPFSQELHTTMLEIEQDQEKVSGGSVRQVFSNLCQQFGERSPESWLSWIQWEQESGRPVDVANIVCRAEASLSPDLRNKFTTLRHLADLTPSLPSS